MPHTEVVVAVSHFELIFVKKELKDHKKDSRKLYIQSNKVEEKVRYG